MFVFTFFYLANFMSVVCGPSRRSSKPLKDMFRLPKFHTYPKLELIQKTTAGCLHLRQRGCWRCKNDTCWERIARHFICLARQMPKVVSGNLGMHRNDFRCIAWAHCASHARATARAHTSVLFSVYSYVECTVHWRLYTNTLYCTVVCIKMVYILVHSKSTSFYHHI